MDIIEQFQADLAGRMEADPFFAGLNIIQEQVGPTESDVANALAGRGATPYVIVFMPERTVQDVADPNPQYELETIIRVLENPRLNRGGGGTGKSASTISLYIEALFHLWFTGTATVSIRRTEPFNDGSGVIGYDVTLRWFTGQTGLRRVASVQITADAANVFLACATPGAAIRYTLDGSFPGPAATLYTAPFAPPQGTALLRACAYADGYQACGIAEASLTQTDS